MTIDQMRKKIIDAYPGGDKWERKVYNMFDDQVVAVYYKFEREGRFSPDYNKKSKVGYGRRAKQLTIDDILKE